MTLRIIIEPEDTGGCNLDCCNPDPDYIWMYGDDGSEERLIPNPYKDIK
tara:strand:+ start:177 stop:323 length:147 start_codon:yes stop_codon:yes gene_type:complete